MGSVPTSSPSPQLHILPPGSFPDALSNGGRPEGRKMKRVLSYPSCFWWWCLSQQQKPNENSDFKSLPFWTTSLFAGLTRIPQRGLASFCWQASRLFPSFPTAESALWSFICMPCVSSFNSPGCIQGSGCLGHRQVCFCPFEHLWNSLLQWQHWVRFSQPWLRF